MNEPLKIVPTPKLKVNCYWQRFKTTEERFWEKVNKNGPLPDPIKYVTLKTPCWIWIGTVNDGRGALHLKNPRRQVKAHRYSWELHHGAIPDGLFVCHACDNMLCQNPEHLWLGTQADNMDDRGKKGRTFVGRTWIMDHPASVPKGAKQWKAVITEDTAREIKNRSRRGESNSEISKVLSVRYSIVWSVVTGKTWKHVV